MTARNGRINGCVDSFIIIDAWWQPTKYFILLMIFDLDQGDMGGAQVIFLPRGLWWLSAALIGSPSPPPRGSFPIFLTLKDGTIKCLSFRCDYLPEVLAGKPFVLLQPPFLSIEGLCFLGVNDLSPVLFQLAARLLNMKKTATLWSLGWKAFLHESLYYDGDISVLHVFIQPFFDHGDQDGIYSIQVVSHSGTHYTQTSLNLKGLLNCLSFNHAWYLWKWSNLHGKFLLYFCRWDGQLGEGETTIKE